MTIRQTSFQRQAPKEDLNKKGTEFPAASDKYNKLQSIFNTWIKF